jgi:O-methyltransferase
LNFCEPNKQVKALELLTQEKAYEREASFTSTVGLTLQPQSFSHFHNHQEFAELFERWTQNDKFRGLDFSRLWALILNCKHALQTCEGALAEVGVYQGQSAAVLSFYAECFGRRLYLCDTFAGFPQEHYEEDMGEGKKAAFKDVTLEAAQAVVGRYSGIEWIVGTFPDSVTPAMRAEQFAFVSIDCDIYEPILQGLRFFWPRLLPGGMIFIHDYSSGYWPGATKAVDEFCQQNGVAGCILPDLAGTYVLTRGRT